ncbi:hypothetical protein [Gemmobacter sp. 24YEA27]|uniref:hypothetical protein n=1 Tax=Gemmobacter sp. 24YEA27 TaxID=3040672 RepID=UPI0024B3738E|nr:hypothetical protein [Gemmobacter sp. 24YEA27]
MTTFFKDFYADWRHKTGSGYFTLFFLSSLVLWNWRVVLILFAGDLTTAEKLEKIDAVTGPIRSFLYPACTAIVVCLTFSATHAVLSFLISRTELWRKSVLAQRSAKIRSIRHNADDEVDASILLSKRISLEKRDKIADKEHLLIEKEAQLRSSIDTVEAETNATARIMGATKLLQALETAGGQVSITSEHDLITSMLGGNLALTPNSHQLRIELQDALDSLIRSRKVALKGAPESGSYSASITIEGYSHLDRIKSIMARRNDAPMAPLTPETDPPSDP